MARITDSFIKRVTHEPSRETFYWDDQLKGFGLRVSPRGRMTFIIQYRNERGRTGRHKLGTASNMKAERARSLAREKLGLIESGGDPSRERRALRERPTLRELSEDYLEQHGPKKRESSLENDRSMLKCIILPALGERLVTEIDSRDISRLHHSRRKTPYHANRVVALLSKMFSLAIQWDIRPDNPAKGIERFPEQSRDRWLNDDEIRALTTALDKSPNHRAANAVRLLLLTGARRNELLQTKWEHIDLERGVWHKPSSHTKQKRTEQVPLNGPAKALLIAMKEKSGDGGGDYLFPGNAEGKPLQDIKKFWARICAKAGLTDVRLHDLRHTFASQLVSSGIPLTVVGRLLGHTQAATTFRYAHLADDPLRDATDRFGTKVQNLSAGTEAEIIRLRR